MHERHTKRVSDAETRWGYLQIPYQYAMLYPKEFKVEFSGKNYDVRLTKRNRIVNRQLTRALGIREGDLLSFSKIAPDRFLIELKRLNQF